MHTIAHDCILPVILSLCHHIRELVHRQAAFVLDTDDEPVTELTSLGIPLFFFLAK